MATKTRRTRAELKEMMLAAGTEVLLDLKPDLGFDQLTYNEVFKHLLETQGQKVTIGSVHERIWSGQREFQLEVLARVIDEVPQQSFAEAYAEVEKLHETADLDTPAGRRYAFQSAVRLTQNRAWKSPTLYSRPEELELSLRLRLWKLTDEHPEAAGFLDKIRQNRMVTITLYQEALWHWMDRLNIHVRADAGDPRTAVENIIMAGTAISTGFLTEVFDYPDKPHLLPSGPDGEAEEWSALAISIWRIIQGTLELADDDLSNVERML